MIRKIQYVMMVLPVVLASWLCFSADFAPAISPDIVVAIDLNEDEGASQPVASVAEEDGAPSEQQIAFGDR